MDLLAGRTLLGSLLFRDAGIALHSVEDTGRVGHTFRFQRQRVSGFRSRSFRLSRYTPSLGSLKDPIFAPSDSRVHVAFALRGSRGVGAGWVCFDSVGVCAAARPKAQAACARGGRCSSPWPRCRGGRRRTLRASPTTRSTRARAKSAGSRCGRVRRLHRLRENMHG